MMDLRQKVLEVTTAASKSNALNTLTTGHQILKPSINSSDETGISYVLFSAIPSIKRPILPKPLIELPKEFRDPFAKENVEADLLVSRIHDTHNLILNKFNIVEEHTVLATIEYIKQEIPLSKADLRAMWTCMLGMDAFAFFNCGFESGASQPHKHMQLISYPCMKKYCNQDMPPILYYINEKIQSLSFTDVLHLPSLPFRHYIYRLNIPSNTESEQAAEVLLEAYNKLLSTAQEEGFNGAYNFLATTSFIFLIPRKVSGCNDIEVNSIGFVGSYFVRNEEQQKFFEMHGPMELLKQVTFPYN